jgi:hypothetical protein
LKKVEKHCPRPSGVVLCQRYNSKQTILKKTFKLNISNANINLSSGL